MQNYERLRAWLQRHDEYPRRNNEIPEEKLRINIDRYGNTSAASVPIILHELRSEGKLAAGDLAMFVAFGAGLTWAANVWRV